jgi:hypothetical protein
MEYWFVIHNLLAYEQHNNLIGCKIKASGEHKPHFKQFGKIRRGDKIVYYATKSNVIVGIFVACSKMTYLADWNSMVIEITPNKMPPYGYYVDFKKALLSDKLSQFDLFPIKERWYGYLEGQTIRKLTEHDYLIISSYLEKNEYLISKDMAKLKSTKQNGRNL